MKKQILFLIAAGLLFSSSIPLGFPGSSSGGGGITPAGEATLTNKTFDADLNALSNISDENIKASAGIDASKIADGSVSNAEFQYINTLSSNAQTQLNTKITASSSDTLTNKTIDADGTGNSITNIDNNEIKAAAGIARSKLASGTAYRVVVNDSSGAFGEASLTASRALVSDANGLPTASSVTSTTLGYLDATSSIQTQLTAAKNLYYQFVLVDPTTDNTATTTVGSFEFEFQNSGTITAVGCYVKTAGTTNLHTVDFNVNGSTILGNKVTIDSTEKSSRTAATAATITSSSVSAGDLLTFDNDAIQTAAAKGLTCRLTLAL